MAAFAQIKAAALTSIDSVLSRWCPGGKQQGREYLPLNPRRSDSKSGSFSINLDTGAWSDFATGDKGGDLIALVAYIEGMKQGEAAKLLASFLGITTEKADTQNRVTSSRNSPVDTGAPATSKKSGWIAVLPVPDDAGEPPAAHSAHGKPSMIWKYHDAAGGLLCLVYRFEPRKGAERKQFCPLTYCENTSGKREWRWQGLPEPRPLYRLPQLVARPGAQVIVCEGEKAADAGALLFPDAVVTTMLNGAQSVRKTDWQALAGRNVWLWPDNDKAGTDCMRLVAGLANEAKATSVQTINLEAFEEPLADKDDAADLLARGWTAEKMALVAAKPEFLLVQTSAPAESAELPITRFHLNDKGVWYFGKNDTGTDAPPLWICSKLEITAVTRDAKNESWGRLLEFDDLDSTHHAWAMPMELLKGDGAEYRGVLLSMGLQMSTMTKARNLLTQYIQTADVVTRARCVERTGWHAGVFVMPDRTIGQADERILYQSANAAPNSFKAKGKLADWQKHVAAASAGNSRLVFAIAAAFAAPLLDITGMESGGFHYRGDSSTGKTTALRVAASVWGGAEYLQRWRATDNGLEALAAQHSDCLLVLDELSQVDPKAAGEVAYMLANGSGKVRSGRTGTMRETASWRLLFISSGEAGLAEHMAQANRKPKAGQEIRLLDIPADAGAGFGLFDSLNGSDSGSLFSKTITDAALKYYGAPAIAYLEKLVQHQADAPGAVKKAQAIFTSTHLAADAGGQASRAALRFALVGAAGELATIWGITGWQLGEARQAAETCFKAWLSQRGGAGNQESAAMLAQVRRFFEMHGEARFTDWDRTVADDTHAAKTVNRAGYRKHIEAKDDDGKPIHTGKFHPEGDEKKAKDTEYYVFPVTFEQEVCTGFDYRTVCRLMVERGMLMTEGKSFKRKERLPGGEYPRCYRITSKIFSDDET
ncbi:DUF927 domain-containing protein [Methylobacillus flagellatus]|uniref:DUF927 domain-containing protein n=1 Tax=Methylobacillus flagellatus TaxID=405 RepID=UPI0010F62688|nr:DUF927 domain-containing protein [Methylobacillus flagellatus]